MASQRFVFVQTAIALLDKGEKEKAVEVLDRMDATYPDRNFPYNTSIAVKYTNEQTVMQAIDTYIQCGEKEKAMAMADRFLEETMQAIKLSAQPYRGTVLSRTDLENNFMLYQYTVDIINQVDTEKAQEYSRALEDYINSLG